jgi:NAD(P)-dependent dehydrogenase (short-subunit alcohol dehydrogenase family)
MPERVCLVTGGSAGIGEALCRSLLAEAVRVVNFDIQPPRLVHERHDEMGRMVAEERCRQTQLSPVPLRPAAPRDRRSERSVNGDWLRRPGAGLPPQAGDGPVRTL